MPRRSSKRTPSLLLVVPVFVSLLGVALLGNFAVAVFVLNYVSNEDWRRERDSNPRSAMRTIAFEATAFNRSAISPGKTVQSLKSSVQRKAGLYIQSTLDYRRCTQDFRHYLNRGCARIEIMAEREGFEPSIRLLGIYSLSRRAPSADSAISPEIQCRV